MDRFDKTIIKRSRFSFRCRTAKKYMGVAMADDALKAKVEEALEQFRPVLQSEGGDMEFVGIDDENKVHVKLTGACEGCSMAVMTIKMGLETYVKNVCPEITEVVQDNAIENPNDFGELY